MQIFEISSPKVYNIFFLVYFFTIWIRIPIDPKKDLDADPDLHCDVPTTHMRLHWQHHMLGSPVNDICTIFD